MNTIKTKRPYHHSEAWLKKHAAKKQMAQKPAKKTAKKEVAKKTSKKMKKQMAQKPAKKTAKKEVVKKPAVKKLTMQNAITFFNRNKKHVSNIKKTTKELGRFLTEVFKTGDEKYISRVLKLFERLGFVYDSETEFVTFKNNAKVKLPKVKAEKPTSEKKPRAKRQPKVVNEQPDGKTSASAEPAPVIAKPVAPAPAPEDVSDELDKQDEEEELAELALTEKREDEDDDEFRERMREEQEIERAAEEEADETRAEIFDAQEENGDFS